MKQVVFGQTKGSFSSTVYESNMMNVEEKWPGSNRQQFEMIYDYQSEVMQGQGVL